MNPTPLARSCRGLGQRARSSTRRQTGRGPESGGRRVAATASEATAQSQLITQRSHGARVGGASGQHSRCRGKAAIDAQRRPDMTSDQAHLGPKEVHGQALTSARISANVAGSVIGRRCPESTRTTVAGFGSRWAISSCASGSTGRSRSLST